MTKRGKSLLIVAPMLVVVGSFLSETFSDESTKTDSVGQGIVIKSALQESINQQDYQKDLELLQSFRKNRNIQQLKEVADEVSTRWLKRDRQLYFEWMLNVSQILISFDFGSDERFVLAEEYVKQALKYKEEMPVGIEVGLVTCLTRDLSSLNGKMGDKEWSAHRKERAELWLHAMRRVEKSIDEKFNPDDRKNWPLTNVMPPIGNGKQILTAGMSPDEVTDPQAQAQYKALIEANNKKADKMNDQLLLRDMRRSFFKIAEKHLALLYSRKPYNVDEVQSLLESYSINLKSREAITAAVKKHK